jgi:hypothetical protein
MNIPVKYIPSEYKAVFLYPAPVVLDQWVEVGDDICEICGANPVGVNCNNGGCDDV